MSWCMVVCHLILAIIWRDASKCPIAEDSFYFCENVQDDYFYITEYNLVRLFLKMDIDLDLPYNSAAHRALESYISVD